MEESLYDKLKSMGVQVGAQNVQPKKDARANGYSIDQVVPGEEVFTQFGEAFITRVRYPGSHYHGLAALCPNCAMDVLAAWGKTPRITQPDGQNVVFLDTETSGLAGGTGTYAFLVGVGYRTDCDFEVVQFFMREPAQEQALLAALNQWLSRFDAIVTFNGKTFDLPLLNTRYTINGLPAPFAPFDHLDVLQIARKLWRDRLPSRALGDLEKDIIRFFRSEEEVPGWMIPQMYFDYLRSGDARPLAGVFYHNAIDILSLAALYGHIAAMLNDPLQQAADHSLDLAAIARLYEEMGMIEQAAALYERSLDDGLPEPFFFKTMERFAQMRRRQGEWEKAAQLWQIAAERGQFSACIELAKYYEHRQRNPTAALHWARKALDRLNDGDRRHMYTRKMIEEEIERRIGRLHKRVYRYEDST